MKVTHFENKDGIGQMIENYPGIDEEWYCYVCHRAFKTKKQLIDDLKQHIEESSTVIDWCVDYLEELGVKSI